VRVLREGQVIVRCRIAPLSRPLEWRSHPPEISIDATMCQRCLLA
jgi:hypothetical protein